MTTLEPLDRPSWLPRPAWPWPTGSPATSAGRIAVTVAGSGPPLLLLIRTGTWRFVWRDLLRALTPQFRCIALDAPGCGRSDALTGWLPSLASSAFGVGRHLSRADREVAPELVPGHTSELTTGPRPAGRGRAGDTLAGANSPL